MFDDIEINIDDIAFDASSPIDVVAITPEKTECYRLSPNASTAESVIPSQHNRGGCCLPSVYSRSSYSDTCLPEIQQSTVDSGPKDSIVPNRQLALGIILFVIPFGFNPNNVLPCPLLPYSHTSTESKFTGYNFGQTQVDIVKAAINEFATFTFRQGELTKALRNKMKADLIKEILAYLEEVERFIVEVEVQQAHSSKGGRTPSKTYKISEDY